MELKFMDEALKFAGKALNAQEVPVGCVFVVNQEIIAGSRNTVNESRNPTRHAELNCIDQVISYCEKHSLHTDDIFKKVCVFVTVEPCIMCAEALHIIGVNKVVYGCANDRFGGSTVFNVSKIHNKSYLQKGGIKGDSAMLLLKEFYKGTNPMAPEPKIKKK